jgi:predicted PurR-regulated permease PerM
MEEVNNTPGQNPQMVRNTSGQSLGIAALITAVITFVLSVIPCVGLIAIIPGIIAVILASVGLSHASRNNSPKGVLIAGMIIAVIAVMISFSQIFVVGKIAQKADHWPNNIQNIINDVQDKVEDGDVSIKIESDGDKVEINTGKNNSDKVKELEELEGASTDSTQKQDTLTKKHEAVPKRK